MTVTVRPIPKRAYQNGIRPFRPVRLPANNIRPYTIKTWRPPTPEPLPPAPLLGPKELLALGALVLTQLWGLFGSRPKTSEPVANPLGLSISGTIPAAGNTVGAAFTYTVGPGTYVNSAFPACDPNPPSSFPGLGPTTLQNVVTAELRTPADKCGVDQISIFVTYTNGGNSDRTFLNSWGIKSFTPSITTAFAGANKQPFRLGAEPVPLPDGYVPPSPEPEAQPDPQTLPAPVPLPLFPAAPPTTAPGGPEPLPLPDPEVVPIQPGPAAPPITAPPIPRPAVPRPLPGAPPIVDGVVVPQPPAPIVVTPPDAHFPVPGAPPVTGNGPRPSPEGIAQELGRLEQKLARLSNPGPGPGGDGTDRLGLLFQVVGQLVEFLTSINAGGTYTLSSPCVLDENGNRVVVPVDYSGSPSSLGVLSNKIDALAQVLQVHKDLKQPNCTVKPALTGEWVSVNFQSDEASPGGERPLRKQLRYRDQKAAPLEAHLAHWQSFAWDAGPVIVVSKNLSWGTPKVWAASAAEGKRVISHAAQMAGVDLTDPKHEWIVTGSSDPRYGRTGRMRLDTRGGKFMRVTSRPGPSGLPSGFSPDS